MLPWQQTVNLNEIHLFVGTWGRREKEYNAGEGLVLWQTGRYLLYASNLVEKSFLRLLPCFLYLHGAAVLVAIFALGNISL